MAFQPIVDLRTREVVGNEALARFRSLPLRPPDEWFAEAVRLELGVQLERTWRSRRTDGSSTREGDRGASGRRSTACSIRPRSRPSRSRGRGTRPAGHRARPRSRRAVDRRLLLRCRVGGTCSCGSARTAPATRPRCCSPARERHRLPQRRRPRVRRDGMLYASLGEAHDPTRAQDPTTWESSGSTPDGSIPGDGPFGAGNPVWTVGHRNCSASASTPRRATCGDRERPRPRRRAEPDRARRQLRVAGRHGDARATTGSSIRSPSSPTRSR